MTEPAQQISFDFSHSDIESAITVRESKKAKHLSIKANPLRGIEVVVPRGTRSDAVKTFIEEHRDWIQHQQAKFSERLVSSSADLPTSICLPAVDHKTWWVEYDFGHKSEGSRHQVREHDHMLHVFADSQRKARKLLNRWLTRKAKEQLVPRLKLLADHVEVEFKKVQVRGQKSLWGSYSTSGTISINFCLLFLPRDLVDYVFIHELCHIKVNNHSQKFWNLVASIRPDYELYEKRLDEAWRYLPGWLSL